MAKLLKICSWNIHGLKNKVDDQMLINSIKEKDVIFLCETCLTDSNGISIDGFYNFSKHNIKGKKGRPSGGLSVFIKDNIRKGINNL